jgi:hypothetical protein
MEATLAAATHSGGTVAEISKSAASSARALSEAHSPSLPDLSEAQLDAIKTHHLVPSPSDSPRIHLENGRLSSADTPHPTDLSLASHPPSAELPPKTPSAVRFRQHFFSSFKNIFSSVRRLPKALFRAPPPRTFSYAPQLVADFQRLEGSSVKIDTFVEDFFNELVNKPDKWKSTMQGKPVVGNLKDIRGTTSKVLSDIHDFITKDYHETEAAVLKRSEQIADNLQPILKSSAQKSRGELISKLGRELASYKSAALQDSRNGNCFDISILLSCPLKHS